MEIKEIKKLKKNLQRFYCESCDFKCYMKCDWDRHVLRPKHTSQSHGNAEEIEKLKKTYFCYCKRQFLTKSGLWKHQKKCDEYIDNNDEKQPIINNILDNDNEINNVNDDDVTEKQLILMLVKQNASLVKENNDFKNMMMEVIKNGINNTNNITNNNNINSNNKTFNLQVFLNETCKDAMNINDFVESIQLQVTDLENVGRLGFVEGISNIIVKNLDKLDITQRPVHCTDKKREVVYIKDDDKWEKEDEQKKKLRNVIKKVANKNERLLFKYKEKYPDCVEADSRRSDQYNKIIIEAMGGRGDNDMEKEDKIIRNITKKVVIDKTN